jgi:serine/threonine-protein kinase
VIGTVINNQYQILELIGEGGMGSVYMALDIELDRRVALKFLKADLGENNVLIQRFRDELRVLASFNHPNITTLYTSVTWQGRPVMVMELVEGETLQKMVDRRGPVPAHVCVPLIGQALAGVSYAHRKKIIHRDLKPANLMLNTDGVVKVMDFGIAKIQNAPGLTRTNTVVGTSLYMAPEQIRGIAADARSDIYAMGVSLYEMLAGRVPFLGDSQYEIEHAHIQQTPDPPTLYYPHIPGGVVEAVMRALAKDPAMRFQTAEEFAAALSGGTAAPVMAAAAAAPEPTILPTPTRPRTETAPDAAPQREFVAPKVPGRNDRRGMPVAVLSGAAIVLLAAGGLLIHSVLNHAPANETYNQAGAGQSGAGNVTTAPVQVAPPPPAQPGPSASDPPFELRPLPSKPAAPSDGTPNPVAPQAIIPAVATPAGYGLAGQWTGSFDRCEDNRSTRIAMTLTEPAQGRVSGTLRYSAPEGSGGCSVDGVVVERGKRLTLKAHCSGSAPAYLAPDHESLLTFSGAELSGNVEPQEPCMTVTLRKNE